MLYTVEGLDASGKSTLIENLSEWAADNQFNSRYIQHERVQKDTDILLTQEPTTQETGQKVREALGSEEGEFHPMSVLFRFLADHAYHINNQLPTRFLQEKLVFTDRYTGSRAAYQSQSVADYFETDPLPKIRELHHKSLSVKPNSRYIDLGKTALSARTTGQNTTTSYHPLVYYFFGLGENPTDELSYPISDFSDLPDLAVEESECPPNWSYVPTKQFYLDTSLDVIESRLQENSDTEIFEKRSFLESVQESYERLIDHSDSSYIRINPSNYQNYYEIVEQVIAPEIFDKD
jgi:dTMP kinase